MATRSAAISDFKIQVSIRGTKEFGIERCPHPTCGVAIPHLTHVHIAQTSELGIFNTAVQCTSCGKLTVIESDFEMTVLEVWPARKSYSTDIPDRARRSLDEARGTLAYPSPSIMCSAKAIDWMLKEKGYVGGSLYERIEKASEITPDMKAWAHDVRLGANAERHADTDEPEPTKEEATRLLKFAEALAEILFELPARIRRDRGPRAASPAKASKGAPTKSKRAVRKQAVT